MAMQPITVEMIGDRVMLRFGYAFATKQRDFKQPVWLEGQLNVSIQNMEEARTLRDALSAFIAFHERFSTQLPVDVAHEYGVGADHPRQEYHAHLAPDDEERIRRELS